MDNQDKKANIKFSFKIILTYLIRDVLYILSFSYLGQGLLNGFYMFISNLGGSLLFMLPTFLINLIITGIPLYFSLNKKWKYRNIIIFILPFIDFIVNWNLFNLQDNIPYQLIRVVLFVISLYIILKLNYKRQIFQN